MPFYWTKLVRAGYYVLSLVDVKPPCDKKSTCTIFFAQSLDDAENESVRKNISSFVLNKRKDKVLRIRGRTEALKLS